MRIPIRFAGVMALLGLYMALPARAQLSIDLEGGVATNGYNDVRIPGDVGTELSLSEELESDPTAFWRARLSYQFGRNTLSAFAAPLRIDAEGRLGRDVRFTDVTFAANTPLTARYRFDSYRLTYRYALVRQPNLELGLGFTGKIRDAAISLESATQSAEKSNTGFVPLINFLLHWRFAERFGLLLEGDALAAPQGRAEDVLLALTVSPARKLDLKLGYRILEGGADNDEVYNFTLVNFASAGLIWRP